MSRFVFFFDEQKQEILGSDGCYKPDQRLSNVSIVEEAREIAKSKGNVKKICYLQIRFGEKLSKSKAVTNIIPIDPTEKVLEKTLGPNIDAILCTATETKTISPKNGKCFELQELYDLIGCKFIQVVPLQKFDGEGKELKESLYLICDEEGKHKNNEVNQIATTIWESYYGKTDVIVGNAIICKIKLIK